MTTISQLPATVDLHFVQGDTFRRRLHFYVSPSIDVNISGWDITAQIRQYAAAEEATDFLIAFVTNGADGEVDISITAAQAALLHSSEVWDLQRVDGGEVLTLLSGTVTVDREVTREQGS